jgi:hypothetical protein
MGSRSVSMERIDICPASEVHEQRDFYEKVTLVKGALFFSLY